MSGDNTYKRAVEAAYIITSSRVASAIDDYLDSKEFQLVAFQLIQSVLENGYHQYSSDFHPMEEKFAVQKFLQMMSREDI